MQDILATMADALTHIDLYGLILPLLVYTLLLALYGIFIWAFYKSVSRRDLFRLEVKDHKKAWQLKILYAFKYLVSFPVLTFLWFAALTMILFFLAKSQTTENILLISMALISATRITAYYKEELSQEIAKILPLAVLGIFVVDPTFFSLSITLAKFNQVPSLVILLTNYLLFTIMLEFVLRLLLTAKIMLFHPAVQAPQHKIRLGRLPHVAGKKINRPNK